MRSSLSWILAVVLMAPIVVNVMNRLRAPRNVTLSRLSSVVLPERSFAGWQAVPRPVADTAEMKRVLQELLNFDEASYVDYESPGMRISVYVAYWRPNKTSYRMVASHTPDLCWAQAGWNARQRETIDAEIDPSTKRTLPLRHRVFVRGDTVEHVVFCHLVGKVPKTYGDQAVPPWHAFLGDLRQHGISLPEEQVFFRVSSDQPFSRFQDAEPYKAFLNRLRAALPPPPL